MRMSQFGKEQIGPPVRFGLGAYDPCLNSGTGTASPSPNPNGQLVPV